MSCPLDELMPAFRACDAYLSLAFGNSAFRFALRAAEVGVCLHILPALLGLPPGLFFLALSCRVGGHEAEE